jgi:hypothetical protein
MSEDQVQNLRRELATLPVEEKGVLATEIVRSLESDHRRRVVSEFYVGSPEERAKDREERAKDRAKDRAQMRMMWTSFLAFLIVGAAIAVLYGTVQTSPESVEIVGGVITTLTGTVAGFIGGRASAGQQPPDGAG